MNATFVFLLAAALLLAKSDGWRKVQVEVRNSNGAVEITGVDGDRVVANGGEVREADGRTVVESGASGGTLKVQVPRGARLEVSTSNGAIRVEGVTGPIELATSNGLITVRDAGNAEIHARTSNGKIEINVPKGINANLSARTSNGRIHCDMPIAASEHGESFLEGKIGNGGPLMDLQTSNGAIYLRNGGGKESVSSTFRPGEVK